MIMGSVDLKETDLMQKLDDIILFTFGVARLCLAYREAAASLALRP
jgi:hypothetical protein